MIIGIDDSGSFEKEHTGMFAAVYIRPKKASKIEQKFLQWESSLPSGCKEKGEVKGKLLSKEQINDFVKVIMNDNGYFQIRHHVFAIPTQGYNSQNVEYQRKKNVMQIVKASNDYKNQGAKYYAIAESYKKMASWLNKRSSKTILKMELLSNTIYGSINDSIKFSVIRKFDRELGKLTIKIDKAFINKEENMTYWRDMFRTAIWNMTYSGEGIIHLTNWNSHHPFIKRFYKYPKSNGNLGVFTNEIRECMNFYDSCEHFEIRIADIVANAYFRKYVLNEKIDAIELLKAGNMSESKKYTVVLMQGEAPSKIPNPYTDEINGESYTDLKKSI